MFSCSVIFLRHSHNRILCSLYDLNMPPITAHTYHGVVGFSDILHQGMSCLRTDGAHNCTRYLFPNSSFPAIARAAMKHLSLRSSISVLLTVGYLTHIEKSHQFGRITKLRELIQHKHLFCSPYCETFIHSVQCFVHTKQSGRKSHNKEQQNKCLCWINSFSFDISIHFVAI